MNYVFILYYNVLFSFMKGNVVTEVLTPMVHWERFFSELGHTIIFIYAARSQELQL